MLRRVFLSLLPAPLLLAQNESWDQPIAPHQIADNLYYVGTKGLASFLITTADGCILINSCFERNVPMIREHVESLGHRMTDIKILLGSHAHNDHMQGNALVRELSGARVFVMEGDDQVIRSGGHGQYMYPAGDWKPCPVDRVLHDGDRVTLGDVTLTAILTPGHTRGCTTWTLPVTDHGRPYLAVIVGSPNVNEGYQLVGNTDYPTIAEDFAKTFAKLKALPCDIFLGAHGDYYDMLTKLEKRKSNPGTNPFVDPEGYRRWVAEKEQAYLKVLATQRG